jgi:hypothetical protein
MSVSFSLLLPCQLEVLSIASDRLDAIVLLKSLFAAGVKPPASLFGVQVGGPIEPLALFGVDLGIPGVLPPNSSAFTLKLLEALEDSLWEIRSRDDGAGRWNGVFGTKTSAGSFDEEMIRGVAFRVPQVMSCFTAAGPSSEGVGDGK